MEQKAHEVINFTYFDPANSIFGAKKSEHATYTVFKCCNKENCAAYARGKCFMRNGLWGSRCPYGTKNTVSGPTPRARSYSDFLSEAKKTFGEYSYKMSDVRFPCVIGDYVYIGLPHLKNYVNPVSEELISESLIKRELFTPEFIAKLVKYHPHAMFGGEIESYQREDVPRFVTQLKRYMPDMYEAAVAVDSYVAKRVGNVNYKGKYALVTTLLPSNVKLGTNTLKWDGTVLRCSGGTIPFWRLSDEDVIITPTDKTFVEIIDNDSVTEETVFKDD